MIIENIENMIRELEKFYFNTIGGQIIFTIITIGCFIFIIIGIIQIYKQTFKKS